MDPQVQEEKKEGNVIPEKMLPAIEALIAVKVKEQIDGKWSNYLIDKGFKDEFMEKVEEKQNSVMQILSAHSNEISALKKYMPDM